MVFVGRNKGFEVYFDCNNQEYIVYKDNKFLIKNKYKYSEVKCYLT